ncbi:MAG: Fe-S cluster assembly protein SufD [Pseudohongiellaceae bacterium]|nr:Fe-S cluster assembly protein SufD [Pseudohongiellaceae bacterium]
MSEFHQQATQLVGHNTDALPWLNALREDGAKQWQNTQWPTRKTELWKYTPVQALERMELSPRGQLSHSLDSIPNGIEIDAYRLVFVDGCFSAALSSSNCPSLTLFSDADTTQKTLIEAKLGTVLNTKRHMFAALNNAWVEEGVLLSVPKNTQLDKPVYLVHVSTGEANQTSSNHRVLVVLEDGSQAQLIEHFVSTADNASGFVNSLCEIEVGNNASLKHYRINLESEGLVHIGGTHIDLLRSARYNGFTIAEGSVLKRIDYHMNHRGEGADLILNGVYLPRNKQVVDYHTNIEHCVPHCTSNEVFRGIIGDSARAVFNGRILIHQDAQKTLAEMNNRNLLTSNKAEVDTKPELEIYADDVKCAHGATIAELDETAMFYLRSRGLTENQARTLLSFGFINELLLEISQEPVRDYLVKHVTSVLEVEAL